MKNNSYTLLQGSNSGITRLKLNDPGTYNSLSTDMLKSLISRFKEFDKGLVVEFGSSYCAQGMNALDWSLENLPADIKTIGIIGNANDYGYDWAKGVEIAAEANGVTVAWSYLPSY